MADERIFLLETKDGAPVYCVGCEARSFQRVHFDDHHLVYRCAHCHRDLVVPFGLYVETLWYDRGGE